MKYKSHKELIVYQKAIDLIEEIYSLTKRLPDTEKFGLISQMRRAAVSIPSNIAEGYKRNTTKEYINFLFIAQGSSAELETQIDIVKRLDKKRILNYNKVDNLLVEVQKMLSVLIKKLKISKP